MKEIPLTQGLSALVDDDDFWHLVRFKWYARVSNGKPYAQTAVTYKGFRLIALQMHNVVMKYVPKGKDIEVDHIDGNSLNNQKANLRLATHRQNIQSAKIRKSRTGYRGVHRENTKNERWNAVIVLGEKTKYIGCYDTPIEAARAYNLAAIEHFGEFARLNPV